MSDIIPVFQIDFLHVVQPATLAANVKAVFTSLLDQVSWCLDRGFDQILVHTGSVFIFILQLSKKEIQECFSPFRSVNI